MDFDHAIAAHSAWKGRILHQFHHPDESLRCAEAEADDQCLLGRWIRNNQSMFSSLPEFVVLHREHARFHKAAADVLRKAESGQPVTEADDLGPKSAFAQAFAALVKAIPAVRRSAMQPHVFL